MQSEDKSYISGKRWNPSCVYGSSHQILVCSLQLGPGGGPGSGWKTVFKWILDQFVPVETWRPALNYTIMKSQKMGKSQKDKKG